MKMRWIILVAAGAIALACWAALGVASFNRPIDRAVWIGLVTATAFASEGFLWVAAGVLGWSFLSGRRKMLAGLKARFARRAPPGGSEV